MKITTNNSLQKAFEIIKSLQNSVIELNYTIPSYTTYNGNLKGVGCYADISASVTSSQKAIPQPDLTVTEPSEWGKLVACETFSGYVRLYFKSEPAQIKVTRLEIMSF